MPKYRITVKEVNIYDVYVESDNMSDAMVTGLDTWLDDTKVNDDVIKFDSTASYVELGNDHELLEEKEV